MAPRIVGNVAQEFLVPLLIRNIAALLVPLESLIELLTLLLLGLTVISVSRLMQEDPL